MAEGGKVPQECDLVRHNKILTEEKMAHRRKHEAMLKKLEMYYKELGDVSDQLQEFSDKLDQDPLLPNISANHYEDCGSMILCYKIGPNERGLENELSMQSLDGIATESLPQPENGTTSPQEPLPEQTEMSETCLRENPEKGF